LLNDLARVDDLEGLLAGDATLVGPKERMVAPLDATGPSCCSNGGKIEHSTLEEVRDTKLQSVYKAAERRSTGGVASLHKRMLDSSATIRGSDATRA
jgi:hypothetical protein